VLNPKFDRIYVDEGESRSHRQAGKFPALGEAMRLAFVLYAGHDTSSGVKVSNEPVRRNQTVEDKFAPAREWMKEVQDETRRTRTGNGYKAYLRASRQYTTKPQT
jgi:hypothetical protein